jgi:plasmid stabilization system protein ParE
MDDARQVHAYYESQKKGLGARFARAVGLALRDVAEQPDAWSRMPGGFRRRKTRRFPYILIYKREADLITVVAITHQKRSARHWRKRL